MYALKAYEIPEYNRQAKGLPIINLLQIEQGEMVSAVIPIRSMDPRDIEQFTLFFATRQGIVKKTPLLDYANIRKTGLIAINLREDDEVIGVRMTDGTREVIMATKHGQSIRFLESDVRSMGRGATGVKGVQLGAGDVVIGMEIIESDTEVLVVTSRGYGKKTPADGYRIQTRGGKGIKTLNCTAKNGYIVGLRMVKPEDDLMIITNAGVAIRIHIDSISRQGRNTQGVKLINVPEGEEVATVALAVSSEDDDEE
jgi:DNA gyrase subunit A